MKDVSLKTTVGENDLNIVDYENNDLEIADHANDQMSTDHDSFCHTTTTTTTNNNNNNNNDENDKRNTDDENIEAIGENKEGGVSDVLGQVTPTGPGSLVKKKHRLLCFPFPPMCVTLVVGPSNCGKSEIVRGIIEKQHLFYNRPLGRIVFVLCNPRAQVKLPRKKNSTRPLAETVLTNIDDFDQDQLQSGDLVIFEDLSVVTECIRSVINVLAHHIQLAGVFVIVQGLVGTKRYELIHYCHKAIFFVKQRTGISNLDYLIRGSMSADRESREYIKSIAGYCQKKATPLLIEINPLEGRRMPKQLAISHLPDLLKGGKSCKPGNFAVVHPYLHSVEEYTNSVDEQSSVKEVATLEMPPQESLPPFSYVLVPANFAVVPDSEEGDAEEDTNDDDDNEDDEDMNSSDDSRGNDSGKLKRKKKKRPSKLSKTMTKGKRQLLGGTKGSGSQCLNPKYWNEAMIVMEESIERSFERKQWLNAKNICRELLQSSKFCITSDMKTVHIKDSCKNVVPILDFVFACIRRNNFKENSLVHASEVKRFGPIIKAMIQSGSPLFIFKNKKLLTAATTSAAANRRRQGIESNR
jgi:hypothetical protein